MLLINTDQNPYSEQVVSLSGISITLIFKYSVITESWYMDIKDRSGTVEILSGVEITSNRNLTGRYILEGFPLGNLYCLKNKVTSNKVTFNNFGPNLEYGLYWIPLNEELEYGIDGIIQL